MQRCGRGGRRPPRRPLLLLGLLVGALPGASGLRRSQGRGSGGSPAAAVSAARAANCSNFALHFGGLGRQVCGGSAFGESPRDVSPRRLALLVRGESFRSGHGQGDRDDHVTNASWHAQREATRSHVEHVVAPLEECGFQVDVFVATYGHAGNGVTKDATNDLFHWYTRHVREMLVVPAGRKGDYTQARMYKEALELVSRHHQKHRVAYDAIFVVRHDVVFKEALVDLPDVQWQNMLLAFKELPFFPNRIADVVQWFPWKYANCAAKCGFPGHRGDCLIEEGGQEHLSFLLPGEHNTNTRSETNALYRLVRGPPNERKAAVLLACGAPFGPELPRGPGHPGAASLASRDQGALASSLAVLGRAFEKHVLVPNNQHVADPLHKVDVIAHCWSPTPEQAFRQAFQPLAAAFEDPAPLEAAFRAKPGVGHHYWESVAWAYSAKRALELLQQHESRSGTLYGRVLFLRPETLLLADIDLDVVMLPASDPAVHGGSDSGTSADFHLAMSRALAGDFVGLYDHLSWQHPAQSHEWIKAFVEGSLKSTILQDDIKSGVDEFSYWKLPSLVKDQCASQQLERLRALGFGAREAEVLGLRCKL